MAIPEGADRAMIKHSVFRSRSASKTCALVMANYGGSKAKRPLVVESVKFKAPCPVVKAGRYRFVDNTTWETWREGDSISFPEKSALVLVPLEL